MSLEIERRVQQNNYASSRGSLTSKSVEDSAVPPRMCDIIFVNVLRKPLEMGSLGDVGLERHYVGALLDLAIVLLDIDESTSW